jgi:hypothetical protein
MAAYSNLTAVNLPSGALVTAVTELIPFDYGAQGVMVGFYKTFTITDPTKFYYDFEVSDDGGDSWFQAPRDSILPTWNQQYSNIMYNPLSPYVQTAGLIGDYELWRVRITGHDVSALSVFTVIPIIKTDEMPFTKWTEIQFPIGDTRP